MEDTEDPAREGATPEPTAVPPPPVSVAPSATGVIAGDPADVEPVDPPKE